MHKSIIISTISELVLMILKLLLFLYLCDYYITNVPKKKHFLFFLVSVVDKWER
nr:MAG TPA: hypothetical protein [Caudoviricetes sp.]